MRTVLVMLTMYTLVLGYLFIEMRDVSRVLQNSAQRDLDQVSGIQVNHQRLEFLENEAAPLVDCLVMDVHRIKALAGIVAPHADPYESCGGSDK